VSNALCAGFFKAFHAPGRRFRRGGSLQALPESRHERGPETRVSREESLSAHGWDRGDGGPEECASGALHALRRPRRQFSERD
jgi:hypothetical protein